jgi:hypothetical protein
MPGMSIEPATADCRKRRRFGEDVICILDPPDGDAP